MMSREDIIKHHLWSWAEWQRWLIDYHEGAEHAESMIVDQISLLAELGGVTIPEGDDGD